MVMEIAHLSDLLREGRYGECREGAEALLLQGGLDRRGLAAVYLALSRSLSGASANQEALGPAELAVHYGRDCGDNDLLGRAICHSAYVYHENRLYKRAVARLAEYFYYYSLYVDARLLEGWVLYNMAVFYRAMGRGAKALEYYVKAYRWHLGEEAPPQQVEKCRANLAWQHLKMGEIGPAEACMEGSEEYLHRFPNDLDARSRHWNNLAFHAYMTGSYRRAMETAARVVGLRGATPLRKAYACMTLHHTARALGKERVAIGMAVLARIQASVARRPDVEEEASRSLLQILQQREGLPLMEDLFSELGLVVRLRQDGADPLPADPAPSAGGKPERH
ncbi:MAG: hypothetical protein ACOY94_25335 [Bacillota bacterium]